MYYGELRPSRGLPPVSSNISLQQGDSSTWNDAVMASEEVESKVFRTACSNEIKLHFEENLKPIEATKVAPIVQLLLAALVVVLFISWVFMLIGALP
jgi:hypothetical protein